MDETRHRKRNAGWNTGEGNSNMNTLLGSSLLESSFVRIINDMDQLKKESVEHGVKIDEIKEWKKDHEGFHRGELDHKRKQEEIRAMNIPIWVLVVVTLLVGFLGVAVTVIIRLLLGP